MPSIGRKKTKTRPGENVFIAVVIVWPRRKVGDEIKEKKTENRQTEGNINHVLSVKEIFPKTHFGCALKPKWKEEEKIGTDNKS